jgi:hypothetical protein
LSIGLGRVVDLSLVVSHCFSPLRDLRGEERNREREARMKVVK